MRVVRICDVTKGSETHPLLRSKTFFRLLSRRWTKPQLVAKHRIDHTVKTGLHKYASFPPPLRATQSKKKIWKKKKRSSLLGLHLEFHTGFSSTRCDTGPTESPSQTAQRQQSVSVLMYSELPSDACRAGRVATKEMHSRRKNVEGFSAQPSPAACHRLPVDGPTLDVNSAFNDFPLATGSSIYLPFPSVSFGFEWLFLFFSPLLLPKV